MYFNFKNMSEVIEQLDKEVGLKSEINQNSKSKTKKGKNSKTNNLVISNIVTNIYAEWENNPEYDDFWA